MEKKRKIRSKWKMVVAVVLAVVTMLGIGMKREERRVEGEPDLLFISYVIKIDLQRSH